MTDPNDLIERLRKIGLNCADAKNFAPWSDLVGRWREDGQVVLEAAHAMRKLVEEREYTLDELAGAWPERRDEVLAGNPDELVAVLVAERDEEIGFGEQTRSVAIRLQALLDEAVGVLEGIDKAGPEVDHPTEAYLSGWELYASGAASVGSIARDFLSKVKDQAT